MTGTWFRSPEEDDETHVVYRDRTHEFALSRAPRPTLELTVDGVARRGVGGPSDALDYSTGSWNLDGDRLTITLPHRREAFDVETVAEDRLVLRRIADTES